MFTFEQYVMIVAIVALMIGVWYILVGMAEMIAKRIKKN